MNQEEAREEYMPPNYRGERWCEYPGCHGFEDPIRGMPEMVRYGAHIPECPCGPGPLEEEE